jgi:prepilin-type N-terminal cleavage/methylation domain-containing protein
MKKTFSPKKKAFSLIELSIVLIIIGLLIAGITGGASLIKSSELRAAAGEARAFQTAVNGFYNQFDSLPGDYATAIGATTAGNGNTQIQYCVTAGCAASVSEGRNAWFMMKTAGVIGNDVLPSSTIAGTATAPTTTAGASNVPLSKIKFGMWDFDYNTTTSQNVVVLTRATSTTSTVADTLVNGTFKSTAVLLPSDALSIDTKTDDGNPTTGKVRGVALTNCLNTGGTAYDTTQTAVKCALSFQVDVNS